MPYPPQGIGGDVWAYPKRGLNFGIYAFADVLKRLVGEYDNFTPLYFGAGTYFFTQSTICSKANIGGDAGYGYASAVEPGVGIVRRMLTAATADYDAYVYIEPATSAYNYIYHPMYSGISPFSPLLGAKMVVYKWMARLLDVANVRFFMGVNNYVADLATLPNWELPYFRYFTDLGDADWMCVQRDSAGGETVVDSKRPVDTSFHIFKIECLVDRTRYYIDGDPVAEITTNLDRDRHSAYRLSFCIRTKEAAAKEMRLAWAVAGLVF
jgi:hypothetical protein